MNELTVEQLRQIAADATASAEGLNVGDVFPSAYGAAAQFGYTGVARSIFTTVWLGVWERRKGEAAGPWGGEVLVTRIDGAQ